MTSYQSIQFTPDGTDYITDHRADDVTGIWEAVNDQGSRWFFYPLPCVITASGGPILRKRIVSACDGFEHLEGLAVATAMREIQANADLVHALLS